MKNLSLNLFFAALLLFVVSCAPTRDLSVAPPGDQRIVIWHKQSGERIDVVTRRNGQYNTEAFSEIDHIFRDRHTGEEYPIDPKLIDVIADLRDKLLMSPSDPIELLSGYRSPESNAKLATVNKYVAKNSYHMKGQAADIRIPEMSSSALEAVAKTMQKGGVALYPDGGPDYGHVHVDTGPVRGWSVVHGKEAGLRPYKPSGRTSSSSSSITPFTAPANRHGIGGRVPVMNGNVKVKPINSYDNLPEPSVIKNELPPPVSPPPPSAKAPVTKVPAAKAPVTVKTKTGNPVHTTAPVTSVPLKGTPKAAPAHKSLDAAKKQWVKTPYHAPAHAPVHAPAHKPAPAKTPAKTTKKKAVNE